VRAVGQSRRVVVEVPARDELAARAHPDLVEDRLEMVLDRVGREEQPGRDLSGGQMLRDELGDGPLASGQAVRERGR